MGEIADALGGKTAGQLIRSQDWNSLVDAVDRLQGGLTTLADQVQTGLEQLANRAEALEQRVEAVAGEVDAVRTQLSQLRYVSLQTARRRYAIGEVAEITARVTDLGGNALAPGDRPWIDFATVLGQLRAAPGFESALGVGERTISVQVNDQGIARVILRADHGSELDLEGEAQVATALTAQVGPQNQTIAQMVLAADTIQDAPLKAAFNVLTAEYDRPNDAVFRNYVDRYWKHYPDRIGPARPPALINFTEYRSTVLAFVKADNDPTTADVSLGSGSIQITFRDWVGPWFEVDYFPRTPLLVDDLKVKLTDAIKPDYRLTIENVKTLMAERLVNKGELARQRELFALQEAVKGVNVTNPPKFLDALTGSISEAIVLQQSVESAQSSAIRAGGSQPAFNALLNTVVSNDVRVEQASAEAATQFLTEVRQEREKLAVQVGRTTEVMEGRMASMTQQIASVNQALVKKADSDLVGVLLRDNG